VFEENGDFGFDNWTEEESMDRRAELEAEGAIIESSTGAAGKKLMDSECVRSGRK
jgi:hypothetical protein